MKEATDITMPYQVRKLLVTILRLRARSDDFEIFLEDIDVMDEDNRHIRTERQKMLVG